MTQTSAGFEALIVQAERSMPPALLARFDERQRNGMWLGFCVYGLLVWGLYRALAALFADPDMAGLVVVFPAMFMLPVVHLVPLLFVGWQKRKAARFFMASGNWPEHV